MSFYPDARVLDVNLTTGEIKTVVIPGETYRLYPGGPALGAYLIMREGMDPKIEPFSPDALLAFSCSAYSGLPMAGSSRLTVTAKSPLTGGLGDAQGGGYFAAHLRLNGWDSILCRGASEKPVYLYVDHDHAELRDAKDVWGLPTLDTEKKIKEELGTEKLEIAEIGPAGENLVRFACVLSFATRAAGRNGMGAVMGSKKLKAIALKRCPPRALADREGFLNHFGKVKQKIAANAGITLLGQHGTDKDLESIHNAGFLITRNWQTGYFPEGAHNITGFTMTDTILTKHDTCYGCAIHCKRVVSVPEKGVIPEYGGPEYETAGTFGSYCGITDLTDVSVGNQLSNMYGMDTISAGATIAFAMECYEKGIITDEMTGGIKLNFGNGAALTPIMEQMATRSTKLGDLLAEGSWRASKSLGAEDLFMGVKGQEFPAHMPQFKHSLSVHYAVNTYGADHMSAEHDPVLMAPADSEIRRRLAMIGIWKGYDNPCELDDEKIRFVMIGEQIYSLIDVLSLCQFAWGPSWQLYGPEDLQPLAKYGLGVDVGLAELMLAGERKINMFRYFNYLAGMRPEKDDTLPKRIFEPMPDGPSKGHQLSREEWENGKKVYYDMIGSDSVTGRPLDSTLRKCSLLWLADIYKA
ncbi:MAG: aldehyde ferredoxin oxidoreductase family protein [Oscillospiraceae bacterium]